MNVSVFTLENSEWINKFLLEILSTERWGDIPLQWDIHTTLGWISRQTRYFGSREQTHSLWGVFLTPLIAPEHEHLRNSLSFSQPPSVPFHPSLTSSGGSNERIERCLLGGILVHWPLCPTRPSIFSLGCSSLWWYQCEIIIKCYIHPKETNGAISWDFNHYRTPGPLFPKMPKMERKFESSWNIFGDDLSSFRWREGWKLIFISYNLTHLFHGLTNILMG